MQELRATDIFRTLFQQLHYNAINLGNYSIISIPLSCFRVVTIIPIFLILNLSPYLFILFDYLNSILIIRVFLLDFSLDILINRVIKFLIRETPFHTTIKIGPSFLQLRYSPNLASLYLMKLISIIPHQLFSILLIYVFILRK